MKGIARSKIFVFFAAIVAIFPSFAAAADEDVESWGQGDVFAARPAMRKISLIGYTRSRHTMEIVSEESGRCVKVTVDVGDRIGSEGVFAILDTTFIDLAIKKNQVNQKRLDNLITYHTKEVRRYTDLVESETAAESKLDSLENVRDQAVFEIQDLKVQEAELKERRARHHSKIPSGWTVTERTVEPGEWVSVGERLGRAGDFSALLVPFSLSPEEYNALKKQNSPIRLFFPDEGEAGAAPEASLERISLAFDPETRKINVDLTVSEGLSEKRGGLRAELTVMVPDPSGAVLVPASAVVERYEEFWLTRHDGKKVRVVFLGNGPQGAIRVRSPEISHGDKFKVKPGQ
jgi:RND family efflux transporter MFP subunit